MKKNIEDRVVTLSSGNVEITYPPLECDTETGEIFDEFCSSFNLTGKFAVVAAPVLQQPIAVFEMVGSDIGRTMPAFLKRLANERKGKGLGHFFMSAMVRIGTPKKTVFDFDRAGQEVRADCRAEMARLDKGVGLGINDYAYGVFHEMEEFPWAHGDLAHKWKQVRNANEQPVFMEGLRHLESAIRGRAPGDIMSVDAFDALYPGAMS